ncbi:unnamed protein product [Miscanthus lutarioriparius]|uniref:Uncharacterized protein n=1 Tax=Miscanthus lutarioriparius TaxID=422564 RepID=A0A811RBH8_9POAL|nr:unnamed protein product [Miscanthus lutarioriparius]
MGTWSSPATAPPVGEQASRHHRSQKHLVHWIIGFVVGSVAGVISGLALKSILKKIKKLIRRRSVDGVMTFSTKLIRRPEQPAFLKKW